MLYYLPIEPLDERYTEQWYRWFPAEFLAQGIPYRVIDGEMLDDEISVGTFLDVNATLYYKAEQLKEIGRLFHTGQVRSGDKFFVADIEFWGIDSIRYLAKLNNLSVGIYGFLHAGSYTVGDFMEPCSPFARAYESAWANVFDLIFVGSAYHKRRYCDLRNVPLHKVVVTGNPYAIEEVKQSVEHRPKQHRVIHTNRPDPEKNPAATLDLFEQLKKAHPEFELMVTTSRKQWGEGHIRTRALQLQERGILEIREGITKQEYLQLLADSKVMTGNTVEENFGYCILEALIVNTVPIVQDAYSHPELVKQDKRCLFSTLDQQRELVVKAMLDPFPVSEYAERYGRSLSQIVAYLR